MMDATDDDGRLLVVVVVVVANANRQKPHLLYLSIFQSIITIMKFIAYLFAAISLTTNMAFAADDRECEGTSSLFRHDKHCG